MRSLTWKEYPNQNKCLFRWCSRIQYYQSATRWLPGPIRYSTVLKGSGSVTALLCREAIKNCVNVRHRYSPCHQSCDSVSSKSLRTPSVQPIRTFFWAIWTKNVLKFCSLGRFLSFTLLLFRGTLKWALISWWSTSVCCQPQISLPHHSVIGNFSWSSVSPWSEMRKSWQHERDTLLRLDNVLFQFLPWGSS